MISVYADHLFPIVGGFLEGLGNQPCKAAKQISRYDYYRKDNKQIEREQVVQSVCYQTVLDEIYFETQASNKPNDEMTHFAVVQ